jgi:nicotinamidase-related amidase
MAPRRSARAGSALLLIDFIHTLDYEYGEALLPHALKAAQSTARLKRRANAADVPVIYVNDNFGEWRSDFRTVVKHCLRCPGRPLAELLKPTKKDFFVLKPKNSGFYQTPLRSLLEDLGVQKILLTGLTTDICVLFTANDAHLLELEVWVVSDCVASANPKDTEYALDYLKRVVSATIVRSDQIAFRNAEAEIAASKSQRRAR